MRILLLGGTGFLGRATAAGLRTHGHDVVVSGRGPGSDLVLDLESATGGAEPTALLGPLADHLAVEQYDRVLNLLGAGLGDDRADVATMVAVNAALPPALARVVTERQPACRLVHAASSTERRPGQAADESEYSRTKHEGSTALRRVAQEVGLPTTILTVHNTYGAGQPRVRFVANVIDRLARGETVALHYPDRVRDFVHVDDVAASIRAALEQPDLTQPGPVEAEVGTGVGTRLADLALLVADVLGRDPSLVVSGTSPGPDPNPTTVSPVRGGTYGLCTTSVQEGLRRTIREE